jgi:hypothetical protein
MTKYKSQDIVTVIKIQRLEWLGHVIRMNDTRIVKKIFEEKLEGRRGRSRPRLRWINNVEEDLRTLGVKIWRRKALEREEWAFVIEEAKVKDRRVTGTKQLFFNRVCLCVSNTFQHKQ